MHGKNLIKKFSMSAEELNRLTSDALGSTTLAELDTAIGKTVAELSPNKIVKGKVIKVQEDGTVVVDVSYKAEGQISLSEFPDPLAVQPGLEIECLVETINDAEGYILLSKRKADRIRGWENIIQTHKEGDSVKGLVLRKIKGGLLVDIGVPVFLPASQVNIRRAGDIGDWIGKEIEARIIKIDEERMNIVISRRKLIEEERETKKAQLLAELAEGQVRKGIVKNIADFGVFVDLGGIDGLLHITDMSWGRVNHPSEMLKLDDEVEVKVLKIDREAKPIKIGLGLKQTIADPALGALSEIEAGATVTGRVTKLMEFGAFVEVAPGVEGLVHISELSWKRVGKTSDVLQP
ncbi:MAG: 30S ribosomal protein S1, partial [Planctomycetota bacterium]